MRIGRISILVATIAFLAVPAALASNLPKLPDTTGHLGSNGFFAKPKSIVYTGDGSRFFTGHPKPHHHAAPLNWTSWTATGGQGSGFDWINNCNPDCAHGTFHQLAVKLAPYRPRHVGGHFIFTRMKVTYTGGENRTVLFKVGHKHSGVFFWSYPS